MHVLIGISIQYCCFIWHVVICFKCKSFYRNFLVFYSKHENILFN